MPTSERRPEIGGFEQATGSAFAIAVGDDRSVQLTLVEMEHSRARPGWEAFSLLFDGPDPAAFGQGTYVAEHADLGSFPLFLVPVRTDGAGQHYEAVFNRPAPIAASTESERP